MVVKRKVTRQSYFTGERDVTIIGLYFINLPTFNVVNFNKGRVHSCLTNRQNWVTEKYKLYERINFSRVTSFFVPINIVIHKKIHVLFFFLFRLQLEKTLYS